MNDFSKRMEEIRDSLGMNKLSFATKLGVSQHTYGNYSKGRMPTIELARAIVEELNVNCFWLLTGKGEMFPEPQASPTNEDIKKYKTEIEELRQENKELKSNTLPPDTELLVNLQKVTMEVVKLSEEKRELLEKLENIPANSSQNPNYEKVVKQYADLLKEHKKLKAHIQQVSDNNRDKEELPSPPEEWPDLIPDPQKIKTVVIEPIPKDSDNKTDTNDHSKAKKIIKK